MSPTSHQSGPGARSGAQARAPTVLGAALALAILIALAALATLPLARPDSAQSNPISPTPPPERTAPVTPSGPGSPRPAAPYPTGSDLRAGVAARLREILRVREQAFGRRDVRLLETIYAPDCACLLSGRAAIARLLSDRAVWRGRAVTVQVRALDRVSERMWVVVASFTSRAFRIEGEDGTLLRAVPAESQRYRFVLVRDAPDSQWLLGDASLLREGGP